MTPREQLECLIRYEDHIGLHTYSQCPCDRRQTRGGTCVLCLREQLAAMTPSATHGCGLYLRKVVEG